MLLVDTPNPFLFLSPNLVICRMEGDNSVSSNPVFGECEPLVLSPSLAGYPHNPGVDWMLPSELVNPSAPGPSQYLPELLHSESFLHHHTPVPPPPPQHAHACTHTHILTL